MGTIIIPVLQRNQGWEGKGNLSLGHSANKRLNGASYAGLHDLEPCASASGRVGSLFIMLRSKDCGGGCVPTGASMEKWGHVPFLCSLILWCWCSSRPLYSLYSCKTSPIPCKNPASLWMMTCTSIPNKKVESSLQVLGRRVGRASRTHTWPQTSGAKAQGQRLQWPPGLYFKTFRGLKLWTICTAYAPHWPYIIKIKNNTNP